mmetsp:Transcript_17619/g.26099  ORF Transcript_17619/g.26099 Transcript_17619/m.26099 type:complete len:170 (+) Transcript_17619:17-526(+)
MRAFAFIFLLFHSLVAVTSKTATADPKECEVCVSVLEKVDALLESGDKRQKDKIEGAIDEFCGQKKLRPKDDKMCYSLKTIKKNVSQPFSLGMPKLKVCQRLKKDNNEICNLRYPIKVEKGSVDYNKMKVKSLKTILRDRGVACEGCVEKSDFVRRCKETEDLDFSDEL